MFQKIIFIGHLGKDPELKYTADAKAVCTFSAATSYKFAGKETTTWLRVTVWNKQAEACARYLHKGSLVMVEGRLSAGEDGNPRMFKRNDDSWGSSYEITAENVRFLESANAEEATW